MSATMVLGRVLLPAFGLALAATLAWQFVATGRTNPAGRPSPPAVPGGPGAPTPTRSAPETATIAAEGRVVAYPGAEVVVGAEQAGTIVRLVVREKATVRKGDLLAEFNSDEVRAAHREALARLAEAESDLARSVRDGIVPAVAPARASPLNREAVRYDLTAARARRDAAKAAAERLGFAVEKTRLVAPIDGVVIACHAFTGETVNAVAPVVTIVDLKRLRIDAEVVESDIGRCAVGAGVTITADGRRSGSWRGVVEEIPDAVVARAIRPEDPARPTDTSVFRVKVAFREPTKLRLGQHVEVRISEKPD